jgi:hypothetical protein
MLRDEAWNVGVVLSGGKTTLEALGKLFAAESVYLFPDYLTISG